MKKSRISLRRLFSNTKFLIVFSLAVAFIFWIVVALEYAPIIDREFENVPVQINLANSVPEKFGLRMFGNQDFSVDITVRGSRYIIGGDLLKPDDFDVSVQTAYVNSAGNHTLQVSVTAKNPEAEYEIVSYSPEYIEVYFDKYEEKELKVEPRIVTELDKLTDNNYIFNENEIILSQKTVKISGAKTEIDKIKKAYADIQIDSKLTENLSMDAPIFLDNGSDEEVKYVSATAGGKDVIPITLPIYKIEMLTASVDFKNIPSEYIDNPLSYSCTPRVFRAAVMQDGETEASDIKIGTIDFNEISDTNNRFVFNADDIPNIKMLDSTDRFNVIINVNSFKSTVVTPSEESITVSGNNKDRFSYDISSLGNITVVGKNFSASDAKDIIITVDSSVLEDEKTTGKVPVSVSLNNHDDCWIYGTYSMIITKS